MLGNEEESPVTLSCTNLGLATACGKKTYGFFVHAGITPPLLPYQVNETGACPAKYGQSGAPHSARQMNRREGVHLPRDTHFFPIWSRRLAGRGR
jgi:hypothetical protein